MEIVAIAIGIFSAALSFALLAAVVYFTLIKEPAESFHAYPPTQAERRARALLKSHLSQKQLEDYNNRKYFDVPSKLNRGRFYRIHCIPGAYNVGVHEPGSLYDRMVCFIPDPGRAVRMPLGDVWLAQKQALECREAYTRAVWHG